MDQINAFNAANVGLKGVGIQGHFEDFKDPDVTLLKVLYFYRLCKKKNMKRFSQQCIFFTLYSLIFV